jgi:GNAT superfamily N-acetyltransferase
MQPENFEIRKIEKEEIPLIRNLTPPEWNIDLGKVYNQHFYQDYFYPAVAILDFEIVGTGIAVVNDNSTWLGTIIVKENYRNKGIGKAITNHLIDHSIAKDIDKIILAASDLGLPVYRKIGFEHDINYLFFKTENPIKKGTVSKCISEINEDEYDRIFELDYAITGEKRKKLITLSLKTGIKFKDKFIKGYYLPDFGSGLIIADSEIAGLELLQYRLSRDTSPICVPETNITAIGYLKSINYFQYFKTPRMYLNKNVKWDPGKVYSRGCGYLG